MIIDPKNPTPAQAKQILIGRLNALARHAASAAKKIDRLDLDSQECHDAFCEALIGVQHFSRTWEDAERQLWATYGLDTVER